QTSHIKEVQAKVKNRCRKSFHEHWKPRYPRAAHAQKRKRRPRLFIEDCWAAFFKQHERLGPEALDCRQRCNKQAILEHAMTYGLIRRAAFTLVAAWQQRASARCCLAT